MLQVRSTQSLNASKGSVQAAVDVLHTRHKLATEEWVGHVLRPAAGHKASQKATLCTA